MKSDYKNIIYNNYHSYHTKKLYGDISLDTIRKQFIFWKYYFSEFLPKNNTITILDAGCGNGGLVYWLLELGFINTIGIDISKEMIDLSKSLSIKNTFQNDIFNHLRNNKNMYDIIFCRDVLEHINKKEVVEIFTLFYDTLKPDGKLIIQVPNGYSPSYGKIFYSDFTHETIFSSAILNQLSEVTGYKSLSIKEISPVPHGIKSELRFILWKLLKLFYKVIQLIENGHTKGFYSQNIIACFNK
jgi:2-polyprenyl-3-methyl-5-hydroxy-6-metoxy-1,4-benzoquinol methylase